MRNNKKIKIKNKPIKKRNYVKIKFRNNYNFYITRTSIKTLKKKLKVSVNHILVANRLLRVGLHVYIIIITSKKNAF